MRTFVKDAFLLRMLEEIETTHGKPVRVEHFPLSEKLRHFGMGHYPKDDYFCFSYFPHKPPTQINVCHELLHICLALAGWPFFNVSEGLYEFHLEKAAVLLLKDLTHHVVLWPMLTELGYSEEPVETAYAKRKAIPAVKSGVLIPGCHPDVHVQIQAAFLANMLLCPIEEGCRRYIQNTALRTMPKESGLAAKIVQAFEQARPFSPQSCLGALYQSLKLTGWPQECLEEYRLSRTYQDFLERVRAIRQATYLHSDSM
jgi:hypothetical protein